MEQEARSGPRVWEALLTAVLDENVCERADRPYPGRGALRSDDTTGTLTGQGRRGGGGRGRGEKSGASTHVTVRQGGGQRGGAGASHQQRYTHTTIARRHSRTPPHSPRSHTERHGGECGGVTHRY